MQKANFNPIRDVGTGTSVQEAQRTGIVKALAVSSQHLIISLHASLTDFQHQHQQCSVWGRSVTTRDSSVHIRWTRRIKSVEAGCTNPSAASPRGQDNSEARALRWFPEFPGGNKLR